MHENNDKVTDPLGKPRKAKRDRQLTQGSGIEKSHIGHCLVALSCPATCPSELKLIIRVSFARSLSDTYMCIEAHEVALQAPAIYSAARSHIEETKSKRSGIADKCTTISRGQVV